MIDIFPLTYDEIKGEDEVNCLDNIFPMSIQKITKDAINFGIDIKTYSRKHNYDAYLDIIFPSEKDMHYYKLVGNIKEGRIVLFHEMGLQVETTISFIVETEIYG